MTKSELIALVNKRDEMDAEIQSAMTELGIDNKGLKAIRRAISEAAAAQKTLDALMGVDPEAAKVVADEKAEAA